jgi:hypothetical protein
MHVVATLAGQLGEAQDLSNIKGDHGEEKTNSHSQRISMKNGANRVLAKERLWIVVDIVALRISGARRCDGTETAYGSIAIPRRRPRCISRAVVGLSRPVSGTHRAVRLAVVPLSGGLGGDQRSPTVNIRRTSEVCAHRPGEILRPLNSQNASSAEWRGSSERGRILLTDALRFGRGGEDEHASCWQDVRHSGGLAHTQDWLWR